MKLNFALALILIFSLTKVGSSDINNESLSVNHIRETDDIEALFDGKSEINGSVLRSLVKFQKMISFDTYNNEIEYFRYFTELFPFVFKNNLFSLENLDNKNFDLDLVYNFNKSSRFGWNSRRNRKKFNLGNINFVLNLNSTITSLEIYDETIKRFPILRVLKSSEYGPKIISVLHGSRKHAEKVSLLIENKDFERLFIFKKALSKEFIKFSIVNCFETIKTSDIFNNDLNFEECKDHFVIISRKTNKKLFDLILTHKDLDTINFPVLIEHFS